MTQYKEPSGTYVRNCGPECTTEKLTLILNAFPPDYRISVHAGRGFEVRVNHDDKSVSLVGM